MQALKRKFIETIQRYQDIERTNEKRQRQRIERQILIVKPEATPHEIENAIDSHDAPHIFAHSVSVLPCLDDCILTFTTVAQF